MIGITHTYTKISLKKSRQYISNDKNMCPEHVFQDAATSAPESKALYEQ